jgi:hypothetical protein
MKIARKNIMLFFLVIILGAYVYFYEFKHEASVKRQHEASLQIFHLPKDSIIKIIIQNTFGTYEFTKNSANQWWIVRPVETQAEQDKIVDVLSELERLKRVESVEPMKVFSLSEFGLEKPAYKIVIYDKHNHSDSISIGTDTPVGNNLYARKGDSTVFVIPTSIKYRINKGLFEWRLKKLLTFNQSDIDSIVIQRKGRKPLILAKKEGKWYIPLLNKRADESNVSGLLSKFSNSNVKTVIAENKNHASTYGLTKPSAIVSFYDKQDHQTLHYTAYIGKKIGNEYYACDKDRPMIFKIDTNMARYAFKGLDFYRNHDFAEIDRGRIDSITIEYDDQIIHMVKDSASWYAVTDTGKVKLKNWKISGLFSDLDFAQIQKFVTNDLKKLGRYGLQKPSLRIRFYHHGQMLQEFLFGKEKKDLVYAYNPEMKEIVMLKKYVMSGAKFKLEDIRE